MMHLKVLFFVLLAWSVAASALQREGRIREEPDRGTVKLPDYVAEPGDAAGSRTEPVVSAAPNKSLADDQNGDGLVSGNEWKGSAHDFIRLDANEDGILSRRELDSYVQIGIDRFAELDANRDGILTKKEWKEPSGHFRQLDRDKNGALSRDEYYFDGRDTTLTTLPWEEQ